MSAEDIPPGKLWFGEIAKEIQEARYGLICVTADNSHKPWLLWEAGALYRGFNDEQFVVPLLINLNKSDLDPNGPLRHFQVIEAKNKDEVSRLMRSINAQFKEDAIPDDLVNAQVERCWEELQAAIARAIAENPTPLKNDAAPEHTFKEAVDKLLAHLKGKAATSLKRYKEALAHLEPYIYHLPLSQIDELTLAPYIEDRLTGKAQPSRERKRKVKAAMTGTVNKELNIVRHVLNHAKSKLKWLDRVPSIPDIKGGDKRHWHTLSWDEQEAVFGYLPPWAKGAYLFAVNTGLRKGEIVNLRWDQLRSEKDLTYFVVPIGTRRNITRPVVLNSIAKKVIAEQRGKSSEFVFTNRKNKQYTVYGTLSWKKAWDRAGMPSGKLINTGVENLKRTFEYRLLAAGVPPQTIDILRGSTKAEIYERGLPLPIEHLAECVEKITVPKDTVIAHGHGRQSNLSKAKWVDKRKLPGRREKGKRVGESAAVVPDSSQFELTGQ